jgi:hypothetical protein
LLACGLSLLSNPLTRSINCSIDCSDTLFWYRWWLTVDPRPQVPYKQLQPQERHQIAKGANRTSIAVAGISPPAWRRPELRFQSIGGSPHERFHTQRLFHGPKKQLICQRSL